MFPGQMKLALCRQQVVFVFNRPGGPPCLGACPEGMLSDV